MERRAEEKEENPGAALSQWYVRIGLWLLNANIKGTFLFIAKFHPSRGRHSKAKDTACYLRGTTAAECHCSQNHGYSWQGRA
jgi:hypothetical protein